MKPIFRMGVIALAALAVASGITYAKTSAARDLADLSLEEILNVEVTSVSRKTERLHDTAAAVYVISAEDIRRSGATNIPEALRMAPGVDVGRISTGQYAVSAHGLNGRFANKLLVLMDRRSIYSPLFSGVLWEDEDTLIEYIERIEVIRGPNAALCTRNFELALVGQYLLDSRHSESLQDNIPAPQRELKRAAYLRAEIKF